MSTPKQENPTSKTARAAPETVRLFYPDAPACFEDALYMRWLDVVRADRAERLRLICENEAMLAEIQSAKFAELPGIIHSVPAILERLRKSASEHDAAAREIIANPTSARNRERMEKALATAATWEH